MFLADEAPKRGRMDEGCQGVPPRYFIYNAKAKILVTDEVTLMRDGNSDRQWENLSLNQHNLLSRRI